MKVQNLLCLSQAEQNMNKKTLLIVEDDPGLQSQLKWSFDGVEVHLAEDEESAMHVIKNHQPQVMTLDLGLPPDPGGFSVGFQILQQVLSQAPHTKIIVVTGQEDREHALNAISQGAYDFFNKPVDAKVLALVVERAFHLYAIEEERRELLKNQNSSPLDGVISSCNSMTQVCKMVERVAPSDLSIMILGESGTGKEVFAKAIHGLSAHAEGKLVAINCAAIPDNLLESELFGHEKGSFTGATARKLGKIELAHKGTLFLDEIGDMPLDLQVKLLRFLQERVIERVGGTETIEIDTRIICATHRDIQNMINAQTFREDLYYRISDVVIELPPLREREEDIVLLAQHFLTKYAQQQNKKVKGLSHDAEQALLDYECKGNVRELEKIIRRAVIMADSEYVQLQDLNITVDMAAHAPESELQVDMPTLKQARELCEIRTIKKALAAAESNVTHAAKLLGISRPTLYGLVEKLGLDLETT